MPLKIPTFLRMHKCKIFAVLIVFIVWWLWEPELEVKRFNSLGLPFKFSNMKYFGDRENVYALETIKNTSALDKMTLIDVESENDSKMTSSNDKSANYFTPNMSKNEETTTEHVEPNLENLIKAKQANNTNIMTYHVYENGFNTTNTQLCPEFGAKIKLAVLITSAISNKEQRLQTRMTWGHFGLRKDIVFAFFIGRTNDTKLLEDIEIENRLYADIIVGNYIDTYRNLTLKSINMLEWVNKYCFNVEFLFKTDDDVVVNIPKLLEFIDEPKDKVDKIYGYVLHDSQVVREPSNKYYVPYSEFTPDTYMDYTLGSPGYLFHKSVAKRLYEICLDEIFLSMEDVYITGVLAEKLNIVRIHVDGFST